MKSKMKTFVVKSGGVKGECSLDPDLFIGLPKYMIYREAVLTVAEKLAEFPDAKFTIVIVCYEKKDEKDSSKYHIFNSYHVLLGLRQYERASRFRKKSEQLLNIDLAYEDDVSPKD